MASNAYESFKSSTIAEKRNLVNLTFSNLSLNGEKLDFMLRSPFDAFVEIPKTAEWWRLVYDLLTTATKRQHISDTFFMQQNLQAA
nr:hypothetical protein [Rickettsia endosymbiont of Ceutorhynchus assimilis]